MPEDSSYYTSEQGSERSQRANNSSSIKDSFDALRGSGAYKKDLRGKRNELDALRMRIKNDKIIQSDNLVILNNYDAIVQERQSVLSAAQQAQAASETKKRSLENEFKPVEAKLSDMKEIHRRELAPLQERYDSARRSLQDIESELSSARRELDSLERQLRRSNDQKRGTLELKFSAQKPLVENWEVQRSSAVNLKNQAEADFESTKSAYLSEERPLEAEIDRLKGLIAIEKATVDEMANKVDNASKRIDYARHVRDNPDETQRLGDLIIKNEAYELELTETVKDVQLAHENLRKQALKAKILLIAGAVILLAIIITVVVLVLNMS